MSYQLPNMPALRMPCTLIFIQGSMRNCHPPCRLQGPVSLWVKPREAKGPVLASVPSATQHQQLFQRHIYWVNKRFYYKYVPRYR